MPTLNKASTSEAIRASGTARLLGWRGGASALVNALRDYVALSSNSSTTRDIRRGILARSVG
jgi:hypothetical protein